MQENHQNKSVENSKQGSDPVVESVSQDRLLFNQMMGGYALMAYRRLNDPEWTMLFVSDWVHTLTGHPPEDFVSGRVTYASIIHPADREMVRSAVHEAVADKDPFQVEYRIITARGEEKWVWEQGRPDAVRQDGKTVIDGLIIDITDKKKMEKALQESLERTFLALDGTDMGIWEWDTVTGEVLYDDNWLRLMGYTPDERWFTVELWKRSLHPDSLSDFEKSIDDYFNGKTAYFELEYRISNKSGEWRWIRSRGKCTAYDQHRKPLRLIGTHQDITERKKLELQSLQAQKMEAIGRLSGGIAHDFNNYLTTIIGYGELMGEELPARGALRECLEEILKAGKNAAALIRQLLAFSRKQLLELEDFDVNTEIRGIKKMLQRLLGEDVRIGISLAPDLKKIRADRIQIQQVIMNLATNARDAMPMGGDLTIETANAELDESYARDHDIKLSPGHYVLISVSDTGCGMDPETKSKIFEPFYTTKHKEHGTGFGLSTVYGIVKQMDGYIWVYSEPEKGTTFKIYLPAIMGESDETAKKKPFPGQQEIKDTETILLVEDDAMVRRLLEVALRHYGYDVIEAMDGQHAVESVDRYEKEIHLMITDVIMPGMNGQELANELKTKRPGIKVLFMSGYSTGTMAHQGILDADVFFIQKPISPKLLIQKVQEVLAAG